MSEPKTIPISYDIEADPDADEFDPYAWYLGTGEDLGLPEGWAAKFQAGLAETRKKVAALMEAAEPDEDEDDSG